MLLPVVYGGMVHTAFCSPNESLQQYESMKTELEQFIDTDMPEDEEVVFYERFTRKWW